MFKKLNILAIVIGSMLMLSGVLYAESPEILKNPGFELFDNFVPKEGDPASSVEKYGWILHHSGEHGMRAIVIKDEKAAHSGKTCLRVEPDGRNEWGGFYNGGGSFKEGDEFVARVWAKGVGTFRIYLYRYNPKSSSPFQGSIGSDLFEVTDEWKEYVCGFKYGAEEKKLGIESVAFAIHVQEGSIVYLDDVSLKKK